MIAYLRLLLKDRLMAWNPASRQRAGQSKGKAVASFIGYCVLFLMLYAMLVALEVLLYRAFSSIGEPATMLALVFLLCTILTLFTSFFFVLSTLFFSKDVEFVSALPISSRGLFASKLLMICTSEAGIALAVCLPAILLYGIGQGMSVGYYLRALLIIPFVPMAPITLVTLLSFLLIRASALWKRREGLTTVMTFVFLGLYMWAVMGFNARVNSSDEESMTAFMVQFITKQRQLLDMLVGFYPPIRWIVNALTMGGFAAAGWWFLFALGSAAVLAGFGWLLGGSYQRLAIKQSEVRARLNAGTKRKIGAEKQRTPLRTLYRREIKEIFSSPTYAVNSLSTAVVVPMMLVVMFFGMRENMAELSSLSGLLALVPKPLYVAISAAAFAIACTMNMAAGPTISREGKRHEFYKTLPVPSRTMMAAKLAMGLTIDLICIAPILLLLLIALPGYAAQTLLALLIGLLYGIASTTFSIVLDASRPRYGWKTETEAMKQSTNGAISMFASMGAAAALGFGCFGLTRLGLTLSLSLGGVARAIALIAALLVWLLLNRTSRGYLEKEVSA